MRRVASLTSSTQAVLALASVSSAMMMDQRRHLGVHLPKADIWMGNFSINREYNEFRNRSGRVPDHNFEKYRALYWRVDEAARRSERHLQDQGYFFLPTLDFGIYKGCAPLFSAKQMRLHFYCHHRAYVESLNTLIKDTTYLGKSLDEIIKSANHDPSAAAIYNNAAQHYNHMFFWKTIQPWGANMPPDLESAINHQYGNLDGLKQALGDAAMNFFGSGWVWWVWDSKLGKFDILSMPGAGCPITLQGVTPLLCMDLWEHTYYTDYENLRAKYVENFWQVVDWHWAERHWKRATGQPYEEMKWV